jgi:hypothetical protein
MRRFGTTLRFAIAFAAVLTAGISSGNNSVGLAYNLNTYPFNMGYSLLWPLTNTFGYGITNPYYVLNRAFQQTAYSPYGYVPYGSRFPNSYGNLNNLSGMQNYQNYQPNGANNANPSAYSQQQYMNNLPPGVNGGVSSNAGPPVQDQIAYQGQSGVQTLQGAPSGSMRGAPLGSMQGTPLGSMPTAAPNRFAGANMQGDTPFVTGFFDLINRQYKGDIGRAFKDRDVVAWAQALGLPISESHSNFGKVRKEAISRVLRDNSMDASSKLEALRVLMR